jgi:DNA-directed RNA polymerase subunit H (RpoH/RPB5)
MDKAFEITIEMYIERGWKIVKTRKSGQMKNWIIEAESLSLPHFPVPEPDTEPDRSRGEKSIAKFIETTSELKTLPLSNLIDFTETEFGCVTIICKGNITTNIKKIEQSSLGKIEIFHVSEMQMNIKNYYLQPDFYKLSNEEHSEFQKFLTKKIGFPILCRSDPISRFFKFQTGDVIKVTNKDSEVSYRIVK